MGFYFAFEVINNTFKSFYFLVEYLDLVDVILFKSFSTILSVVDMRLLFTIA